MKVATTLYGLACIQAVFAGCPFADLRRSGVLSEEDLAKFEQVKRDPAQAEALLKRYQARKIKRDATPEPEPQAEKRGLIGPLTNGLLDLPFGGGLCMYLSTRKTNTNLYPQ